MNNKIKDGNFLYTIESCCGCGGCRYICPVAAIHMEVADDGAIYPDINVEKCISCHLCIDNCAFQNIHDYSTPIQGYAAVNNNKNQLEVSASGGAFSAIASKFIKKGAVCGSTIKYKKSNLEVTHIVVKEEDNLDMLYGSKYVYSNLNNIWKDIERYLKKGEKVLFSGTPCQVAQVKNLFQQYKEQLYTIDIVCHGTPPEQIFTEYIKMIEKKEKGRVCEFKFRDKKQGWGKYGSVIFEKNGYRKTINLPEWTSSYYSFFMEGNLQRENCFHCPYAEPKRCSDLTLGDYWGVEKYQPQILKSNDGIFDEFKGISAILVNTRRGKELLEGINAILIPAEVESIVSGNSQLRHPVSKGKLYTQIKEVYRKRGYKAVEQIFLIQKVKGKIKRLINLLRVK